MARLLVLVEGQSEETFVKRVLVPHLEQFNIWAKPSLLRTKRIMAGGSFKGGVVSYSQIRKDTLALLSDSKAWVTSLIDFYGLPDGFPGLDEINAMIERYQAVRKLEERFAKNIGNKRFIPFLALHEFEAWLFSSPAIIAEHFGRKELNQALLGIRDAVSNPEEINDKLDSHPSRRLERLIPNYKKTSDGPTILQKIGIKTIRMECRHFNEWLTHLEQLAEF